MKIKTAKRLAIVLIVFAIGSLGLSPNPASAHSTSQTAASVCNDTKPVVLGQIVSHAHFLNSGPSYYGYYECLTWNWVVGPASYYCFYHSYRLKPSNESFGPMPGFTCQYGQVPSMP